MRLGQKTQFFGILCMRSTTSKPASFFNDHVRHACFMYYQPAHVITKIFSACAATVNLALFFMGNPLSYDFSEHCRCNGCPSAWQVCSRVLRRPSLTRSSPK
ncbi:hypothetical protein B0H10DRAFT_2070254 [Mycena sp. CBHHK59/15]|nr:hypothetical protein B0H10DRAFT_2070254 [Mycena sp. CBHHK59/15]